MHDWTCQASEQPMSQDDDDDAPDSGDKKNDQLSWPSAESIGIKVDCQAEGEN